MTPPLIAVKADAGQGTENGSPGLPAHGGDMAFSHAWAQLKQAPHRMFFFTGMWQLAALAVWWAVLLTARLAGIHIELVLPAVFLHGGAFLFLMFMPFMAGFLLTVMPRWQPAPPVPFRLQWFAFIGFNLGQILFLVGAHVSPMLVALGLGLLVIAWSTLLAGLASSLIRAQARVIHAFGVLTGVLFGFAGLLLFLHAVTSGDWSSWPLMREIGIWCFLLPVYFSVSHRMVPFFSSRVVMGYQAWRPDGVLLAVLALSILRGALSRWPEWAWLASVPLAPLLLLCSWKWWPRSRHGNALLSVLHLSLLWLGGGVALYALQDLLPAFGVNDLLGRAPLHVLGIGFFGGMLVSMVTRVSLGHSGRPLMLDRLSWLVFLTVQASMLLRATGEILVLNGLPQPYSLLMALAALAWLAAFVAWATRFIGVYLRPRVDGAPG